MIPAPILCDEHSYLNSDGTPKLVYHDLYGNLNHIFVIINAGSSTESIQNHIKEYINPFCEEYVNNDFDVRLRDDLEMLMCVIAALTVNSALAKQLLNRCSFEPCEDYTYYVGFKQALLGLTLNDVDLTNNALQNLDDSNATKFQYFPSKPLIFSSLNSDSDLLTRAVKMIPAKFRGYAKRMNAISKDGIIQLARMDRSWSTPLYDWAFIRAAHERGCEVNYSNDMWFPKERVLAI